jgi:cyclase
VVALGEQLGAQALIAALPLSRGVAGLNWFDHRSRVEKPLGKDLLDVLSGGVISEALVIDWKNEGRPVGFDLALLDDFPRGDVPLIAFGGLSQAEQLRTVLQMPQLAAAAVGNFLNYHEHALQRYKLQLADLSLRPAVLARSEPGEAA